MPRVVALRSLFTALLLAACSRNDTAASDSATTVPATGNGPAYAYDRVTLDTSHAPGTIIDSVFPMPEMIRRFRAGLPETTRLIGGAASRDELITAFVKALGARDKQTLGALTLSRAEFAYLYLPNVPELTRSNGLPPQRQWDQLVLTSEQGIARALERVGGRSLTLTAVTCPDGPSRLGAIERQTGCTVRLTGPGGFTFDGRLFGGIAQVGGQYKFISYANDM